MKTATKTKNAKSEKKEGIVDSAEELAFLLKEDPSLIEKGQLKIGDDMLGIFSDDTLSGNFKNFNKMKIEALKMAIEDFSKGVTTLITSTIGLTYKNNLIQVFISPLGSAPSGNVVYSVNLKNRAAFKNWRKDSGAEISQDEINAVIYSLTVYWSKLL